MEGIKPNIQGLSYDAVLLHHFYYFTLSFSYSRTHLLYRFNFVEQTKPSLCIYNSQEPPRQYYVHYERPELSQFIQCRQKYTAK